MKKVKKEVKSVRLKNLEDKFRIAEKSRNYLEEELSKIKDKQEKLKVEIRKEKQAITFMNRAKRLRGLKKVSPKKKNN